MYLYNNIIIPKESLVFTKTGELKYYVDRNIYIDLGKFNYQDYEKKLEKGEVEIHYARDGEQVSPKL